jgi:antitoxin YefM
VRLTDIFVGMAEERAVLPALATLARMTRIMVMTTESLAEVKAKFSAYVDAVERTHERVEITRHGVPVAVLVSPDDLASLEETVAILSDQATMQRIAESEAEIERGELVTAEDLAKAMSERSAA